MATQRFQYREDIGLGQLAGSSDDYGPIASRFGGLDILWPDGTSANQADAFWADLGVTETGSGSTSYDLDSLSAGPGGATVSFAEIRALFINVTAGECSLSPNVSNGWTALLADASDILTLQTGARLRLICGGDGEYPVSAMDKVLDIAALGSGVTYDILIVGATA